jgi:ferredoxin--NADP+ reductase
MPPRIAIVGAGPAGLYCADGLLRKLTDARIDLYDRLFAPFGLVRYGVAPDHQGTKAVTRLLDRLIAKGNPRFLGQITLGRDVTLDELRRHYRAVVLATGCAIDRRLGIPGEDLAGVIGSGAFSRWYNCHPDAQACPVELARVRRAAVIGNGNVAIDVARVLAKSAEELAGSDLTDAARAAFASCPIEEVLIIGRRGPVEANFTNAELAELGRLARAAPVVDPSDLPDAIGEVAGDRKVKEANLATLRGFVDMPAKPVRIRFLFHCVPVAFEGAGHLSAIRLRHGDGTEEKLPIDLAVSCIGYRGAAIDGAPFDTERGTVPNAEGRVAPGLYVTGWARRGPSGVIPTNRTDGMALADKIAADLAELTPPEDESDLLDRLRERGVKVVTYDDWHRHDLAEIAAAAPGAPRNKSAIFLG